MNLKTSSALLLMILLTACTTASPTAEIITPMPLSTLTPTVTPISSETSTPKPTETATAFPTPEVQLHGLVKLYGDFHVYETAEDVRAAYEWAKANVYTDGVSKDLFHGSFSTFKFTGTVFDRGIYVNNHSTNAAIMDSYVTPEGVYVITYRIYGTVDNGTPEGVQDAIVMPIVINGDLGAQSVNNSLVSLNYAGSRPNDVTFFLTHLDVKSHKTTDPVTQMLRERITSNARVVELLKQIEALAVDGKLPSQALIDEILTLDPNAFIQR